jgi:hypothetical protein
MGVGEALERERAVEHGLELALAERVEQMGSEPLAARERFLRECACGR